MTEPDQPTQRLPGGSGVPEQSARPPAPQPEYQPPTAATTRAEQAPAAPPPRGNRTLVLVLAGVLGLVVIVAGVLFFTGVFSKKTPAVAAPPAPAPVVATPTDADVRLEPVAFLGPDPFTSPVGADVLDIPAANPPIGTIANGGLPGLYGGTNETRCDKNQLVAFLQADQRKLAAFAAVLGIAPAAVPTSVDGFAEAVLRSDTTVTTHGYRNGDAVRVPALLQAGTRILVDEKGNPVVKCQTGSPLAAPGAYANPNYTGQRWATFAAGAVTRIQPAPQALTSVQLTNIYNGRVYQVAVSAGTSAAPPPATPIPTPSPTPTPAAPVVAVVASAPAVTISCSPGSPPTTPAGTVVVKNSTSQMISVQQVDRAANNTFGTVIQAGASQTYQAAVDDLFWVYDSRANCVDVVSGPGNAEVK